MRDTENCRNCLLRDLAEKADLYAYVQRARGLLGKSEQAPDALYESRLAICRACPNLLAATCRKCGCYVEIRAARKDAHCPLTHRKW